MLGNFAEWLINFRGPLLEEMAKRGNSVYACAPDASEKIRTQLAKIGVNYVNIPLSRDKLDPLLDIRTIVRFYKLLVKIKPDYVFVYTIKPVVFGSFAAKLAGVDTIISMVEGLGFVYSESANKKSWLKYLVNFLYRKSLKFSSRTIFLNKEDAQFFKETRLIHEDQGVVLNGTGVDLEYYTVSPMPEQISFLMIARLIKEKGIYEYIKAAETVKKDFPAVQFNLVGWIDEHPSSLSEKELKSLVDKGNVNYLGRLDDVRPAITSASVFVLPSYREGFPRTIQEAMAMGRPVITTDVPGCRETVVEGVNGYMVPAEDVEGLVNAMEKFIKIPELASEMGQQSRNTAVSYFNKDDITKRILKIIGL